MRGEETAVSPLYTYNSHHEGTPMTRFPISSRWLALLAVLTVSDVASAITLRVDCDQKRGLTTVNAALNLLKRAEVSGEPRRIVVAGACKENLVIQGTDRLTLSAEAKASITDASDNTQPTVFISDSRGIE